MKEGNSLPLGADSGRFVDEPESRRTAARERGVQVVYHEANVVNSGTASRNEASHWTVRTGGFEKLDEGIPGRDPDDTRSISVVERDFREAEDVAIEGKGLTVGADGNADVRDAGAAGVVIFHQGLALRCENDEHNLGSAGTAWNPGAFAEEGMSNSVAVTDATFGTEIEGHKGLAVVDFWAAWCGPCRMIAPILDQLATEYTGKAKVAKVDVDANQKTAMRFNVRSIPSILFFKDGKHVDTVVGAVPKSHLERKFAEHA